jgi:hypothetical protein
MARHARSLVLFSFSALLAGCQDLSSEVCPPLLWQLRASFVSQGLEPSSAAFQRQYANAMQACMRDPVAFESVLKLAAR